MEEILHHPGMVINFSKYWSKLPVPQLVRLPDFWLPSTVSIQNSSDSAVSGESTSLKTNMSPKSDHFSREYIFQPSIFKGHVSFQGSIYPHLVDRWFSTTGPQVRLPIPSPTSIRCLGRSFGGFYHQGFVWWNTVDGWNLIILYQLPPLKRKHGSWKWWLLNRNLLFQGTICRCYVSFPGCSRYLILLFTFIYKCHPDGDLPGFWTWLDMSPECGSWFWINSHNSGPWIFWSVHLSGIKCGFQKSQRKKQM